MQLTVDGHNKYGKFDILSIEISKEIQHDIISLGHDHVLGYINDKQFKLKVLGLIIRSEAE